MPNSHYNFFEAQRQHKQNSMLLYRLFALVVAMHALLLLMVCLMAGVAITGDMNLSYFWFALLVLAIYIILGIFIQKYQLAQGGVAIAKKMGAVRLFLDKTGWRETEFFPNFIRASDIHNLPSGYARFYEFAEQMSIASGMPLPLLYVLPNEAGINAFVAGFDEKDTVLVLTQGAIDNLDNESLYGLIAHQYSAMIHGDGELNLKVSVMTTGLSWFYECAEWLERLLLGNFHAEYHGKEVIKNTPLTKDDWVKQWQQEYRTVNSNYHFRSYQYNNDPDAKAFAFALSFPLFGLLLAIRLVGLLGMASSDWIVAKFNKERAFLADATSIQLTRSFGVGQLLTELIKKSSFLNNPNANHLGYFFFAPVKAKEEFFDSHPSIEERLEKLSLKEYFVKSIEITKPLDKKVLDNSHDFILKHAPIIALAEEILIEKVTYQEAPKDMVVDGRLVVNQDWFDWSADDTHNKETINNSKTIATQLAPKLSDDIFALEHIKTLQTDWIISKSQRTLLSTIILIEGVQLMRFKQLPYGHNFDLFDIYHKPVVDDNFQQNLNCYPHSIGDDLLLAVSKLDRSADGVLTYLAIKKLHQHLNNPNIPINDKQLKILTVYYNKLSALLNHQETNKEPPTPIQDYARLLAKIYKLYQGAVLALVLKVVGEKLKQTIATQNTKRILQAISNGMPTLANMPQNSQISFFLLAFLVSVQDNSLLLGQTDKLTATLGRLARLYGLQIALDDGELVACMHLSHRLTVGEWAVLLLSLTKMDNARVLLETLHTACLYDTALAQKENDLLLLLKALLEELP